MLFGLFICIVGGLMLFAAHAIWMLKEKHTCRLVIGLTVSGSAVMCAGVLIAISNFPCNPVAEYIYRSVVYG